MQQTIDTTKTPKIKKLLQSIESLQAEFETSPFEADIVEAEGQITAAEALIAEHQAEPESLTPEQIIQGREEAKLALEAAQITLRRVIAKRDNFQNLLETKLRELRGDALAVVKEVREAFEESIKDAFIELTDGYWSEFETGYATPTKVAMHRGRKLREQERILSSHDTVDRSTMIRRIIDAVECAAKHA